MWGVGGREGSGEGVVGFGEDVGVEQGMARFGAGYDWVYIDYLCVCKVGDEGGRG